jgi:hypothetical protein
MCFVIYLLLLICAYPQGKEKKASPPGEGFFKKRIHSSPREGALGEGYLKKQKGASPSAREGALGEGYFKKQRELPRVPGHKALGEDVF